MIKGDSAGRSTGFGPGACSFETGFCPHGGTVSPAHLQLVFSSADLISWLVPYEAFKAATEADLQPRIIHKGTMGTFKIDSEPRLPGRSIHFSVIMFESSMMFTITDYAMKSDKKHGVSNIFVQYRLQH